jgi:hypothetical protein
VIKADLRWHLACFGGEGEDGLVFSSPMGTPMRHSNFYRRVWLPAVRKAGLQSVHFHDLRHSGNALTADAGANLRELMERVGHSSTRAALVYLHSTTERQRARGCGRQGRPRSTPQGRRSQARPGTIWHESGTPSRSGLVKPDNPPRNVCPEQGI